MDPLTITALLSAGTSIAQGIGNKSRARKSRQAFDAAESAIPEQDPMQVAFLDDVRRNRKAFMAGTDPISAYSRQAAQDMASQTQNTLTRMGRGSASDILRSQRMGDRAMQAAGARGAQNALSLMPMEGTLVNAMAKRAFDTQWSRANRLWSEYARGQEDGNSQIMAGLAMLPDIAIGSVKRAPSQTTPSTKPMRPKSIDNFMGDDTQLLTPSRRRSLSYGYEPF